MASKKDLKLWYLNLVSQTWNGYYLETSQSDLSLMKNQTCIQLIKCQIWHRIETRKNFNLTTGKPNLKNLLTDSFDLESLLQHVINHLNPLLVLI